MNVDTIAISPRVRRSLAVALATCAALLATAPPAATRADFPPYTKIVTIAVVAPLSGPSKQFGLDLSAGVQQAIDDANARRGLADFGFVMHSFDDQADPGIAQQEAQFALVDESTSFVIGHLGAQETLLALPVYYQQRVPLIIPTVPLAALTQQGYDNVFRVCPSDDIEGQQDARYAERVLKAKKAAVLYEENDYGYDAANGFVNYAKSGKAMEVKEFSVDVDLKKASAAVEALKAFDPDLVYVSGGGPDMAKVVTKLRAAGMDAPLLASSAFFSEAVAKSMGKAAEGMTVSSCVPPVERMPTAQSFLRRYETQRGRPSAFALYGYVAGQIAIAAAQQSRTTDRRTLDHQLSVGTFSTAVGTVSFQKNGDPADPNEYLYVYKDGAFKYVGAVYPNPAIL